MDVELTIQAGELLRCALRDGEGESLYERRVPVADQIIAEQALETLDLQVSPPPWQEPEPRALREALEAVGNCLAWQLPRELMSRLSRLPGERPLRLQGQPGIPWELAFEGKAPLLERFDLTREAPTRGTWVPDPELGGRAAILLDPERILGSDPEAVRQAMEGLEVSELHGAEVDARALRVALGQGYSVVVLSACTGKDGTVCLADSRPTFRELLGTLPPMRPRLVMLHIPCMFGNRPWNRLAGWAHALLAQGVEAVLGPQWDVPWAVASDFFRDVLLYLRQGRTLGEAVRGARRHLPRDAYLSQVSWVLWGNPHLTARDLHPRKPGLAATRQARLRPSARLLLREGPRAGQAVPIFPAVLERGRPLTVGGPGLRDNDIDLEDSSVPAQALSLQLTGEGLCLLPSSVRPLTLNGLPVSTRHPLATGDQIRVGQTLIELEVDPDSLPSLASEPPIAPLPSSEARYWLQVTRGPFEDANRRVPLNAPSTLVGRAREAELSLTEGSVSRRHCAVVTWADESYVRVLGSGLTLVNGLPVEGEKPLRHGDRIQLGDWTELTFLDATRRPEGD